ncbi:MAG: hypothetical protein AAGD22_16710 [Verrucomicrobiota bacterium]
MRSISGAPLFLDTKTLAALDRLRVILWPPVNAPPKIKKPTEPTRNV